MRPLGCHDLRSAAWAHSADQWPSKCRNTRPCCHWMMCWKSWSLNKGRTQMARMLRLDRTKGPARESPSWAKKMESEPCCLPVPSITNVRTQPLRRVQGAPGNDWGRNTLTWLHHCLSQKELRAFSDLGQSNCLCGWEWLRRFKVGAARMGPPFPPAQLWLPQGFSLANSERKAGCKNG